jgi:hypothetical protein
LISLIIGYEEFSALCSVAALAIVATIYTPDMNALGSGSSNYTINLHYS